jgi:hypothetical protein
MAALAASALTASAQSNVYSLNIVGYVNVPLNTPKTKVTALANQFTVAAGTTNENKADAVLAPIMDGSKDGDSFQFWEYNGLVGFFHKYIVDSGIATYGIADANDNDISDYSQIPTMKPGVGFMYQPLGSGLTALTFVGQIAGPFPATFTNTISGLPKTTFLAGALPIGGNLVTAAAFPVTVGDGTSVQMWQYNGVVGYWNKFIWDDLGNAGDPQWYQSDDATAAGAVTVSAGTAMQIGLPSSSDRAWIQTISQ